MQMFRDEVWMRDVRVEKVAICEMGAVDVLGEEGEEEEPGGGIEEGGGRYDHDGRGEKKNEGAKTRKVVDQVYKEIASIALP